MTEVSAAILDDEESLSMIDLFASPLVHVAAQIHECVCVCVCVCVCNHMYFLIFCFSNAFQNCGLPQWLTCYECIY